MKIVKQKITNAITYSMDSDVTGKVYFWDNKVFRAINNSQINRVKQLFDSGLIADLERNNLIPKTWICDDYEMDGYNMLLQHELILVDLRPNQWSTEMFIDASKLILKVNKILSKYGFALQDAHAYNIMFKGTNPLYVDIGSFMPLEKGYTTLNSFAQEYPSYFHHYIKLIESNHIRLYRSLVNSYEMGFQLNDYLAFKYGEEFLKNKLFRRVINIKYNSLYYNQSISGRIRNKIQKKTSVQIEIKSPHDRSDYRNPTNSFNLSYFEASLENINHTGINSFWGEYHSSILHSPHFTKERFKQLAMLVKKLNIKTAIEIGGNQGYFTEVLLNENAVSHVVCSDYDEDALNAMYRIFKSKGATNVTPMYLDFSLPYADSKDENGLYNRVKQDIVIMLAVTHHLILTQQMPIDFIFKRLSKFAEKFVLVEFMPLGLYDPDNPRFSIEPPIWYTEEWFRKSFEKHFDFIDRIQTEANRIAFVGKIISNQKL